MARPAPKPFNPKEIKSQAEYAREAVEAAKTAAKTGKGRINRGEELSDTGGAAPHTGTGSMIKKKKP